MNQNITIYYDEGGKIEIRNIFLRKYVPISVLRHENQQIDLESLLGLEQSINIL